MGLPGPYALSATAAIAHVVAHRSAPAPRGAGQGILTKETALALCVELDLLITEENEDAFFEELSGGGGTATTTMFGVNMTPDEAAAATARPPARPRPPSHERTQP